MGDPLLQPEARNPDEPPKPDVRNLAVANELVAHIVVTSVIFMPLTGSDGGRLSSPPSGAVGAKGRIQRVRVDLVGLTGARSKPQGWSAGS